MKRSLHLFLAGLTLLILSSRSSHAGIVTFGSGANSFNMEFVTIGNAGNTADITGSPNPAGAVAYEYQMKEADLRRYSQIHCWGKQRRLFQKLVGGKKE